MKTVSLLDFRHDAERILAQVQLGQRIVLTRRGKPVARLEPVLNDAIAADDAFYQLGELSSDGGDSLTNDRIDEIVYGE